jgi:hypothetical protein
MALNWQSAIWESNNNTAIGHYYATHADVSETTVVPMLIDGPDIMKYVVPDNKKVTLKGITITGYGPWQQTTTPPQNTGIFYLRINSVNKAEWRSMDSGWALATGVTRYKENCLGRGFFGNVGWSDGLQFAQGTQIDIRLIPQNVNMPKLIHAWLYGFQTNDSIPVLMKTRQIILGATTDVLQYTVGASGFTLLYFGAEGFHNDQNLIGHINIVVNGRPILEVPFMYSNDSLSKPPNVTINLGDGVTLNPRDMVKFQAANIFQMGARFTAMLHGEIEDLGGLTETIISKDFPRSYIRAGNASELKSKVG